MIYEKMQVPRELLSLQLWPESRPSSLPSLVSPMCPVLHAFLLCLLPKKDLRQLLALGFWNHPRSSFH